MTRRFILRAVVGAGAAVILAVPTASATVVDPIDIPPAATSKSAQVNVLIRQGKFLTFTVPNTKKGRAFRKSLQGKTVTVSCFGVDATNTLVLTETGDVKWGKKKASLKAKLLSPMVAQECGIGKDLFGLKGGRFSAIDVMNDKPGAAPSPQYVTDFKVTEELISQMFGAEIVLAFNNVKSPTTQQVVDTINESEDYTPPLPLVALTSSGQYPDNAHLGLWTNATTLRANMVNATDGQQLASIWYASNGVKPA